MKSGLSNYPVRTDLEKTIGQTVKFFKSFNNRLGHPAILGIEPFNERIPWEYLLTNLRQSFFMNFIPM